MEIIEDEVVVELKLGVLSNEWAKNYSEFGLEVIRKVSPQKAYWLIKYDTSKINPDDFISKLDEDKDVLNADFNKKVDKREE
jgi:hypothetical protein